MSFAVAAEAYDRFMGRYSAFLAPQIAAFAHVADSQRVLDVGCGPGALTTELVRRLGAASVTAVDPSESFVDAARKRLPGVTVEVASAELLPFPDRTFDAVIAQLVVHFMPDPVAGLAEMARVTRPQGVVAACVWDHAGGRGPLGLSGKRRENSTRRSTMNPVFRASEPATSRSCWQRRACTTSRAPSWT
jgi:ubiquinone/menaquinone biosynthesis C-methylase UbiE